MKPKFLPLLERCIGNGIDLGYNRAHKHTDSPTQQQMGQAIYDAIMNEIFESFDFEELNNVGA
jgi:hypothetical protein